MQGTHNESIAPKENSESVEDKELQTLDEENYSGAIDDLTDTTNAQMPDESKLASKQSDKTPRSFVKWLKKITHY